MNQELNIQQLEMPSTMYQVIDGLPKFGKVKLVANGYSYLDIEDNFIHQIYPLLTHAGVMKADYFSAKNNHIGAHVSITYPEENTQLNISESDKAIAFGIVGLFCASLFGNKYFVLKVDAPELIKMRQKYGLGNKMQLKGYAIDPHITIAYSLS